MISKNEPGDCRPCGDYGALNNRTLPERYPLSPIHDFTEKLTIITISSKIGIIKAYFQIPVAPKDVPKVAARAIPFGLRNAAETFQMFISEVCRVLRFVFAYVDAILVASASAEVNRQHLRLLFGRRKLY